VAIPERCAFRQISTLHLGDNEHKFLPPAQKRDFIHVRNAAHSQKTQRERMVHASVGTWWVYGLTRMATWIQSVPLVSFTPFLALWIRFCSLLTPGADCGLGTARFICLRGVLWFICIIGAIHLCWLCYNTANLTTQADRINEVR